ncbi:MAG: hypothetical protein IPN76_30960 [Saprospiraceae bacterium]|nr:hypothetical protein [Saprospiraceae bacterium]
MEECPWRRCRASSSSFGTTASKYPFVRQHERASPAPATTSGFLRGKNTSELDRYLFRKPRLHDDKPTLQLGNGHGGLFLSWSNATTGNPRYQATPNDLSNLPPKEDYYPASLFGNYTNSFQNTIWGKPQPSEYGQAEGFASAYANSRTFTSNPPVFTSLGQMPNSHCVSRIMPACTNKPSA